MTFNDDRWFGNHGKQGVYRNGFMDGMRNCGFLLIDTTDKEVQLSDEWERIVSQSYRDRGYSNDVEQQTRSMWRFVREIIEENEMMRKEIKDLRGLLEEANERVFDE